jgi:hypothetical protein
MRRWRGTDASQRIADSVLTSDRAPQWGRVKGSKMMGTGYKLRDLHAQRVQVELDLGGRCVTVSGIAEYNNGELRIGVEDPAGDFTVVLGDALWNGEISDAPDGSGFLIRLHDAIK